MSEPTQSTTQTRSDHLATSDTDLQCLSRQSSEFLTTLFIDASTRHRKESGHQNCGSDAIMDAAHGPPSSVGAKCAPLVLRVNDTSASSGVLPKHRIACCHALNATVDHNKLHCSPCSHCFISMKLTGASTPAGDARPVAEFIPLCSPRGRPHDCLYPVSFANRGYGSDSCV